MTSLSPRRRELLVHLSQGRTNIEIARLMYLEESTVKTHIRHLFRKLGARNRAHAVHLGYLHGLLRVPSRAVSERELEQALVVAAAVGGHDSRWPQRLARNVAVLLRQRGMDVTDRVEVTDHGD
ncbi:hypothetical protein GCM10012275_38550 [Longimycelium tulufanense]|uniref:HTH luxR-type domain-containing protein n=1 Tax=Longimycelium tulufanense TaxID=907463 RepID=A0A8J3CDQ3_9PSEU|nr:LuxR C-terminal-related transcriptional regulator [Longimycelium tulufanense]GGM64280.1 hypothetical protein GCM10012275_38550 [Longimycelium tulufanense]